MAPPFRWHTAPRKDNKNDGIQDDDDQDDNNNVTAAATAAVGCWQKVGALLRSKRQIVVLTGAGISVSCGIPDFRSKNSGLYHTLDATALGLSSPEELFDIHFFREDPVPFYKFAKQLYFPGGGDTADPPVKVTPSDTHKLLALLDEKKMLLRIYSQNIDGLEETAGVQPQRIAYVHGSLKFATCETCRRKVNSADFEDDIRAGRVARCRRRHQNNNRTTTPTRTGTRTSARKKRARDPDNNNSSNNSSSSMPSNVCGGVLKPGVTFFGEALQDSVKTKLEADREKVDALIVIGTSLSVAPISKVIDYLPKSIPRILINRNIAHPPSSSAHHGQQQVEEEEFRHNYVFDAYLLGNCDDVMRALGKLLFDPNPDNSDELPPPVMLSDTTDEALLDRWKAVTVPKDRVFLFPGADPPPPLQRPLSTTAPPKKSNTVGRMVLVGATCDHCAADIHDVIQTCRVCFDYELCRECYPIASLTHFDGTHQFQFEAAEAAALD